jgi:hypothetical protein
MWDWRRGAVVGPEKPRGSKFFGRKERLRGEEKFLKC